MISNRIEDWASARKAQRDALLAGHIEWSNDRLTIADLSVRYASTDTVLEGLSTGFVGGACHCVMGPNGVGKTTFLNAIAGTLKDSVPDIPVTYLIQEYARSLLPWASVFDNLFLPYRRAMTAADYRGRLEAFVDRYVSFREVLKWSKRARELSGGQKQLAALLRACTSDEPIVLLDEPFSSLDASTRCQVAEDLRRFARTEGRLVIATMHVADDALQLADSVLVADSRPITGFERIIVDIDERGPGWLTSSEANRVRRAVCQVLE